MICKKLKKARRLLHLRVLRYATDHAVLPAGMDKQWVRPSVDAARFYNDIMETVLAYPTMETFFNLLADFVLYDAATLPIFENLTPELLSILNDIFDALKLSGRIKYDI